MKNRDELISDIRSTSLMTGVAGFFMSGAIMFFGMALLSTISFTSFWVCMILTLLFAYGAEKLAITLAEKVDNNEYGQ